MADKKSDVKAKLLKKPRRTRVIEMMIGNEKIEWEFQALSPKENKDLTARFPATPAQRKANPRAEVNVEALAPALVAACSLDPKITEEEAKEIWESEDWSSGELGWLFDQVVSLNTDGAGVPFGVNDSE